MSLAEKRAKAELCQCNILKIEDISSNVCEYQGTGSSLARPEGGWQLKVHLNLQDEHNGTFVLGMIPASTSYKVNQVYLQWGPGELFSNIGGNLGLLLGWSILSIFSSFSAKFEHFMLKYIK